jgi:predicted nuclease with TOPRIM domain
MQWALQGLPERIRELVRSQGGQAVSEKFFKAREGQIRLIQLERELNRSNEMFRKLNIHSLDLTDRIRRLEELVEIGGRMVDIGQKIVHQGGEDMYWIRKLEEELTEWTTAKEAKP